jgi:hypothetical protein
MTIAFVTVSFVPDWRPSLDCRPENCTARTEPRSDISGQPPPPAVGSAVGQTPVLRRKQVALTLTHRTLTLGALVHP